MTITKLLCKWSILGVNEAKINSRTIRFKQDSFADNWRQFMHIDLPLYCADVIVLLVPIPMKSLRFWPFSGCF